MTSGNAEPPNHVTLGPFIAYFEKACKPRERWRVGIEHERFAYRLHDRRPASYRGEDGIEGFLNRLARQGWRPIYEGPHIVKVTRGAAAVSLEPGGQVEFASAPAASLHVLDADVQRHAREIARAAEDVGLGFFALGLQPHWPPEEIPWVPKQRFAIMRGYMPRVGRCGLDMMQSTCSIQASFDYADERDVVRKTRLALAAQPLVAALFANSPFAAGRPSERHRYRSCADRHSRLRQRRSVAIYTCRPRLGFVARRGRSHWDVILGG